jgi:hypothetical protein
LLFTLYHRAVGILETFPLLAFSGLLLIQPFSEFDSNAISRVIDTNIVGRIGALFALNRSPCKFRAKVHERLEYDFFGWTKHAVILCDYQ